MTDNPLISLIVAVYNLEDCVGKCMESLVAQTYGNIEIVAVNDGSRDGSLAVLEKFAAADPRVKIVDKPNGGLVMARHDGFRASVGGLVVFVDGDDYLDTKCVERLHEALRESGCDAASARRIRVCDDYSSEENCGAEGIMHREEYIDALLTHRVKSYITGKLFRRSLFDNVAFYPHISMWEDFVFNLQTALSDGFGSICFTRDAYYFYVQRRTSMIRGKDDLGYIEKFNDTVDKIYVAAPIQVDDILRLAEKVMRYNFYIKKSRNPWRGDSPAFMEVARQVERRKRELKRLIPPPAVRDMLFYRNRRYKFLINLCASFRRWGRSVSRRTTRRLNIGELK